MKGRLLVLKGKEDEKGMTSVKMKEGINNPNLEARKGGSEMVKRLVSRINRVERGITGLETAIILIAFVVVASVFAYTVLSAGLFSTQKSQEAVYSGLEEARSTLQLDGAVIAKDNDADSTYVDQLTFTLANALEGEPINFTVPTDSSPQDGIADDGSANVVVFSYIDKYQRVDDLYWTKTELGDGDGDDLLEPGERFQIDVCGSTAETDGLEAALTTALGTDTEFSIEIKPPNGAALTIERTTPSVIDSVMNLN